MQLNGYHRNTNPKLSERHDVYSFTGIFSEYTHTNRSLPHILTRADSVNTERAFQEKSLISLFVQCGFKTAWISNQDPAATYVSFINECDTVAYVHPEMSVYNYNNWLDEDMLPYIEKMIPEKFNKRLYILHTIGSHWYYNNHYSSDYEIFKPITKSRIISQNTPDQIINSYDNTVLYTDFFVNEVIKLFESKNAVVIFLSDHGELLGEDGMWLHASDHDALKNPAMFVWFSDAYLSRNKLIINAIKHNRLKFYRTDFFYHSVLSAAGIKSETISMDLNIFKIQ
jgi:glucan phosphoethanolaminetransferase (alkaline phosphatase superfamily)